MRKYINDNWYYKDDFKNSYLKEVKLDSFTKVRIPHTIKELDYNYINSEDYQKIVSYYTEIDLKMYSNNYVYLVFEGSAHVSYVYLNGKLALTHYNGYTGFKVLLNDYKDSDDKVKVLVKVDSKESNNVPPFGKVVDYLTYGGIYRDTYLDIKNENFITDCFINAPMDKSLTLNLKYFADYQKYHVHITLNDLDVILPCKETLTFSDLNVELWDINNPNLYDLVIELLKDDEVIDVVKEKVGFRSIKSDYNGIYLNDKPIKIRGLNRHQSYPIVGYAMPKRPQILDAHILKEELGLNSVRTSHYPQSHDFINECDKLGLLVFMEIPGWQHIGDKSWQEVAINNVKEMILQYRNHPSIYMWGVRINESIDNHDFYKETNKIAKELDKTRLIGGVRCFKNSELLEDVYTYNDFVHNGTNKGVESRRKVTKSNYKAYLVTEYNGHMYPTKMFDDELHRSEHLKRHYKVLNDINYYDDIAGGYGWCMADYNTHKDFGSGDEICYHGVLDMYRNPKIASYAYSSQQDEKPVLALNSSMDIGEHAGGYIKNIMVMTNLDYIKLYRGETFIKDFYPSNKYPNLKHPPIMIDDLIGDNIKNNEPYSPKISQKIKRSLLEIQQYGLENMPLKTKLRMLNLIVFHGLTLATGFELYEKYIGAWGEDSKEYLIEGYKNNEKVRVIRLQSYKRLHFNYQYDTLSLIEDKSYDVASFRVEALNQADNHLNYFNEAIRIETSGCVSLIGPSIVSFKGGFAGFYIKSNGIGKGNVKIYYQDKLVKEFKMNVSKGEEVC